MSDLSPKQHAKRAAIFLILGMAFAIIPAVGMYHEPTRELFWLWALFGFATIPAVGWGSVHLAKSRGYSSGAGCGLSIVAYIVSGFLGTTSPHPRRLPKCQVTRLNPPLLDNNPYNHQRSHVRRPSADEFIPGHTTSGQTYC